MIALYQFITVSRVHYGVYYYQCLQMQPYYMFYIYDILLLKLIFVNEDATKGYKSFSMDFQHIRNTEVSYFIVLVM